MLPKIFYLTVHDLLYQIEQVIAIDANEKNTQTPFCLTLRRKMLFDCEMHKLAELF